MSLRELEFRIQKYLELYGYLPNDIKVLDSQQWNEVTHYENTYSSGGMLYSNRVKNIFCKKESNPHKKAIDTILRQCKCSLEPFSQGRMSVYTKE